VVWRRFWETSPGPRSGSSLTPSPTNSAVLHQQRVEGNCGAYCCYIQYLFLEVPMNHALRQHYRPKADRLPQWLLRVWGWF
jgi:hypothetical protein